MIIGIDLDYTLIYRGTSKNDVWEIPGATEYIKKRLELGDAFVLITARDIMEREVVYSILEYFEERASFSFLDVHFTAGNPKGKWAKSAGCSIMIDDRKSFLSDCEAHGVFPVLFDGDWSNVL